jgi:hypothetical protein
MHLGHTKKLGRLCDTNHTIYIKTGQIRTSLLASMKPVDRVVVLHGRVTECERTTKRSCSTTATTWLDSQENNVEVAKVHED